MNNLYRVDRNPLPKPNLRWTIAKRVAGWESFEDDLDSDEEPENKGSQSA